MIETLILVLASGIVGAVIRDFIVRNKKFRILKLSDSNITVFMFDKNFGDCTTKHYIGIKKGDHIIGAIALSDEGVTDVKLDI